MKNILLAFFVLIAVGCSEQPLEAKRRFRNEQIIQKLWTVAQPVKTESDVIGCWIAEGSDLPKKTKYKTYQISFSPHGTLSSSMIYKDGSGLGAPPLVYKIIKSKLFTDAVEVTPETPGAEEIRTYKQLLLLQDKSEVTVFRRCSK